MATLAAGSAGVLAPVGWTWGDALDSLGTIPAPRVWPRWPARARFRFPHLTSRIVLAGIALLTILGGLIAARSLTTSDPLQRTPWAYHRSEEPLTLGGFGMGRTETVPLAGDLDVAWFAFAQDGCRFRARLVGPAGEGPLVADLLIQPAAAHTAHLRGIASGSYTLEVASACAWSATFLDPAR